MIFNATNIGEKLTGIGRYSLMLAQYFLQHWTQPFQLYINQRAKSHFTAFEQHPNIHIISRLASPDLRFAGHLMRFLWTNKISSFNSKELFFNSSQLEASVIHRQQVITVHDLIPLIFPRYHLRQYHFLKYVLPPVLRQSKKIITVSNHTKALIIDYFGIAEDKIEVIYNGVSFDSQPTAPIDTQLTERRERPYILYVGRISPTKNIERIITAFDRLRNDYHIDCDLKLTGTRHAVDLTCCRISELTRRHIHFLPQVSDDHLKTLYQQASLLAFPSLYEGFGLPPLEAMAAGCPTVVSDVASLPEICGDATCYVDPYAIDSIAEGFFKVMTDTALRTRLIEKGLVRSQQFSWERSAQAHIAVFNALV